MPKTKSRSPTIRQGSTATNVAKLAAELGSPPERIPLHPFGAFRGNEQSYLFDEASLAAIQAQLDDRGVDFVVDWHHQTLDQEAGLRDDAPAAAWLSGITVEDGYVYGVVSEWTSKAAQAVQEGAYRFISAVFNYDRAGRVLRYHSFGLVNRPGTHHQRRIGLTAAFDSTPDEILEEISEGQAPERDGKEDMDKEFLAALGLAEDATKEQVLEAIKNLQGPAALGAKASEILNLQEAADTPANRGRLMALASQGDMTAELVALTAEVQQLRHGGTSDRAERLVTAALSEGRITAPQKDYWLEQAKRDYAGAQAYLASAPAIVPVAVSLADQVTTKTDTARLEEGQQEILEMMGVDVETFKKYNPKEA